MDDFVQIEDFPGYFINRKGEIISTRKYIYGRLLKPCKNTFGYYFVNLYKDKKKCIKYIHRLVALTFIPNHNNYTEIDHINQDKDDNRESNLQWTTRSLNNRNRKNWGKCTLKYIYITKNNDILQYRIIIPLKEINKNGKYKTIKRYCPLSTPTVHLELLRNIMIRHYNPDIFKDNPNIISNNIQPQILLEHNNDN